MKLLLKRLTTPSGSTSSKCLGRPRCRPLSTYWPGLVVLSLTRKSPSRLRSFSASRRLIRLWYQGSRRSCSSFGATGALRRGGLGHWSSNTRPPPTPPSAPEPPDIVDPTPQASWSFRASSKGPTETTKALEMFHKVLLFPHSVVVCLTSKRSVDNRKRTVSKRESGGNQTFERKSGCRSVIYICPKMS